MHSRSDSPSTESSISLTTVLIEDQDSITTETVADNDESDESDTFDEDILNYTDLKNLIDQLDKLITKLEKMTHRYFYFWQYPYGKNELHSIIHAFIALVSFMAFISLFISALTLGFTYQVSDSLFYFMISASVIFCVASSLFVVESFIFCDSTEDPETSIFVRNRLIPGLPDSDRQNIHALFTRIYKRIPADQPFEFERYSWTVGLFIRLAIDYRSRLSRMELECKEANPKLIAKYQQLQLFKPPSDTTQNENITTIEPPSL
jgi:hypothetical protein